MSVYQEASDRYIQRVSQTDPAVSKTGEDSHALSWGSPEMVQLGLNLEKSRLLMEKARDSSQSTYTEFDVSKDYFRFELLSLLETVV